MKLNIFFMICVACKYEIWLNNVTKRRRYYTFSFSWNFLLATLSKKNEQENEWSINVSQTFPVHCVPTYPFSFLVICAIERSVRKLLRFDPSLQTTFRTRLMLIVDLWRLCADVALIKYKVLIILIMCLDTFELWCYFLQIFYMCKFVKEIIIVHEWCCP